MRSQRRPGGPPELLARTQVNYQDVIVYATSQREWKQCAAFQDVVTADLHSDDLAGNLARIGTTGLRISHVAPDVDHIMDLATGLPVGKANNTKANYTLLCLPAADGPGDPALVGARAPAALMCSSRRLESDAQGSRQMNVQSSLPVGGMQDAWTGCAALARDRPGGRSVRVNASAPACPTEARIQRPHAMSRDACALGQAARARSRRRA